MPDTRSHRGPGPEDATLFAPERIETLHHAVSDLNWLLGRGYADKSSVKLVGDRYSLTARQRVAVMRCACSDQKRQRRAEKEVYPEALRGQPVIVDGYNVLITIEAALSGGVLMAGADACIRDLASIHGTYRKVEETLGALETIAEAFMRLGVKEVVWLLDTPVSNSGRLKQLIVEWARQKGLNWIVELAQNPDKILILSERVVISSDSVVLDECGRWFNFVSNAIEEPASFKTGLWLVDLSGAG